MSYTCLQYAILCAFFFIDCIRNVPRPKLKLPCIGFSAAEFFSSLFLLSSLMLKSVSSLAWVVTCDLGSHQSTFPWISRLKTNQHSTHDVINFFPIVVKCCNNKNLARHHPIFSSSVVSPVGALASRSLQMTMLSRTTVGIAAVCGTLFMGYCIYFDKKRRSAPDFKKKLRERRELPAPRSYTFAACCIMAY